MLLKALDLLRTLSWGIIHFIYSLIDSLFDILRGLNAFDIINSVSGDNNFITFQKSIIAIALTLLGLFAITRFAKKIIDPDESMSSEGIVKEIIKCGILIIMSTFLFVQASTFSIKLAGFTSNIFSSGGTTLSASMETMFIDYSDGYKDSDEFKGEDIDKNIKNGNFDGKKMYNDKYVTSSRWILPDEKDYKYSINWILAIIVGGFFLYALFFSGMMLARRQLEFLFLFVISPVVFATSIGNKQRRSAVIEQLVSLMLQGAVVMLIISLTGIVMKEIAGTTFFTDNTFKDILVKSLMYIGAGTFLLTGSQVVNRFIGGNVSANSGREQLMSLMGFGQAMNTATSAVGGAGIGAGMVGLGVASSGVGLVGGNKAVKSIGNAITNFGNKISNNANNPKSAMDKIGNFISKTGASIEQKTPSALGKNLRHGGMSNIRGSVNSLMPQRAMYRNRYKSR